MKLLKNQIKPALAGLAVASMSATAYATETLGERADAISGSVDGIAGLVLNLLAVVGVVIFGFGCYELYNASQGRGRAGKAFSAIVVAICLVSAWGFLEIGEQTIVGNTNSSASFRADAGF